VEERITMSNTMTDPNETLRGLSEGDLSVLNTLVRMTEGSLVDSGLDPETFMLARIAALTALDAAPASWLVNIKVGGEAGLSPERIVGTLIAIAPVVGTARVVSAAGGIVRAFGLAGAIAEETGPGAGTGTKAGS
jgi:alkylhydroperoxidase/carboxymuconolactone decarboxylase family protein YurZ